MLLYHIPRGLSKAFWYATITVVIRMKYKILLGVIAAIFLCGVVGGVLVLSAPPQERVEIVSDGEVVRTVTLSRAQDTTFDIAYEGRTNTIEINESRIRVRDAECPDRTCVHMGWLRGSGLPIVCVPHHLIIRYEEQADVDAVAR